MDCDWFLTGVDAVQLRSHVNPTARISETMPKIEAGEGALAQLKERASATIVTEPNSAEIDFANF